MSKNYSLWTKCIYIFKNLFSLIICDVKVFIKICLAINNFLIYIHTHIYTQIINDIRRFVLIYVNKNIKILLIFVTKYYHRK